MEERAVTTKAALAAVTGSLGLCLAILAIRLPGSHTDGLGKGVSMVPAALNLGTVSVEETPKHLDRAACFRNDSDMPVRIGRVTSTCGCTIGGIDPKILQPAQVAWLDITLNRASASGPRESVITVHCDAPETPRVEFPVRYELEDTVRADPGIVRLDFSTRQTSIESVLRLTATGDITFNDVHVTLPTAEEGRVLGKLIGTETYRQNGEDANTVLEMCIGWEARGGLADQPEQVRVRWANGWKDVPVKVSCRPDYDVDPPRILLVPLDVKERVERDVRISRTDNQAFAVTGIKNTVPGLQVTALGDGRFANHAFRFTFERAEPGVVSGEVSFETDPAQPWPVTVKFDTLVK
jgi:hypothetical protein